MSAALLWEWAPVGLAIGLSLLWGLLHRGRGRDSAGSFCGGMGDCGAGDPDGLRSSACSRVCSLHAPDKEPSSIE